MIIQEPSYIKFAKTEDTTTFIRYSNIVTRLEQAENVVFSTYVEDIEELKFRILGIKTLKPSVNIIIDATVELLADEIVEMLLTLPNIEKIYVYANGIRDIELRSKIVHSNINYIEKSFFIEYLHYYTPENNKTQNTKEKRKFLLLTGKPKIERSIFVKKLIEKGLHNYGYISYFGVKQDSNFCVDDTPVSLLTTKYKTEVEKFFSKYGSNFILDTRKFTYEISHSRSYEKQYYDLVDFVIVLESDVKSPVIFHTEKTTKPLQLNKKIVILNKQGALNDLKYKMQKIHNRDITNLTDWVDITYDSVTDIEEKIDLLIGIIEKECSK